MIGNVLLKVELQKGTGSFKFPELLRKNNFQTSAQCYRISYNSFSQQIEKLPCFVICDASYFRDGEKPYTFNTLAMFSPKRHVRDTIEFCNGIQAALNVVPEWIHVYTVDPAGELVDLDGYLHLGVSGEIASQLLL